MDVKDGFPIRPTNDAQKHGSPEPPPSADARIDDSFQPISVIDVITKTCKHNLADDLKLFFWSRPQDFVDVKPGERTDRIWVNSLKPEGAEALFLMPTTNFPVELRVRVRLHAELRSGGSIRPVNYSGVVRMRYILNLMSVNRKCDFAGVIVNPEQAMVVLHPEKIITDQFLLPVMRDEDYETLAKRIRRTYHLGAGKIDAAELASRMELYIAAGRFPEDDILAELYMQGGRGLVIDPTDKAALERDLNPQPNRFPVPKHDPDKMKAYDRSVSASTIILSVDAYKDKTTYNNSVVHECMHFICVQKYYLLQRLYGRQVRSFVCKKKHISAPRSTPRGRLSLNDIMEIHANRLTEYLMIDTESGKAKAEELLNSYPHHGIGDMSRLVRDVADYFGTTLTAARTRLDAMGYIGVRGTFQYANGEAVPVYVSDLAHGQTYTISLDDSLRLYATNADFRAVLDTNRFAYCEAHYCLREDKYIIIDCRGNMYLTEYARTHMSECCLVFDEINAPTSDLSAPGVWQKSVVSGKQTSYNQSSNNTYITGSVLEFGERVRAECEKAKRGPEI